MAVAAVVIFHPAVASAADEKAKMRQEAPPDAKLVEKETSDAPPNAQAIEGSYYRGNGLSYNLELRLKPNGQYTAKWDSCLYKSGEALGTWKLSDKRSRARC